jgi:hypothetical protein
MRHRPRKQPRKGPADAKFRAQRTEIESLRVQVRAGDAQLQAVLTKAEERYVAALAERDRAYAQQIVVFRRAVEDIAATPEGVAVLVRVQRRGRD